MFEERIKVLKIEPKQHPYVYYVKPSIQAFKDEIQADVIADGGIEAKKIGQGIYAIFNKDRFLTGLVPNRSIASDIIVGNILIIGIGNNRLPCSLTEGQISRYSMLLYEYQDFDEIDVIDANMDIFSARFLNNEK